MREGYDDGVGVCANILICVMINAGYLSWAWAALFLKVKVERRGLCYLPLGATQANVNKRPLNLKG